MEPCNFSAGYMQVLAFCLATLVFSSSAKSPQRSLRYVQDHKGSLDARSLHAMLAETRQEIVHLSSHSDVKPGKDGAAVTDKYDALGWGTLIALFVFLFLFGLIKFVMLAISYWRHIEGFEKKGFSEYCWYSMESWFISSNAASAKLITLVFLFTVLVGSLLCGIVMEHKNPFTSLWYVCGWVMDPGSAFGLEDHHLMAYFLSAALGIMGILMLALLLTLMQDSFNNSMDKLRKGDSAVMESNHIMIIGYTPHTIPLLHELCHAHKDVGGTSIVVLSSLHNKAEMDAAIAAAEVQTMGSTIVTRCGRPDSPADLRHVAAHTSKTIILLPKLDEDLDRRDAWMLRTLIILRGQGWPCKGRIVAVCSLVRNHKLFRDVGGESTDIVMLENFIGKVMTRCSGQPGLSSTLSQIFSSGGSDFFIHAVPKHLYGLQFSKAREYYPSAVPVGILDGNGDAPEEPLAASSDRSCHLCPGKDFILNEGQDLVFIARDPASLQASPTAVLSAAVPISREHMKEVKSISNHASCGDPETIFIWGWNEFAGNLILELDRQVPHETELIVISEHVSIEEREADVARVQTRWKCQTKNLKITNHVGRLASRLDMENLPVPVDKASRIFLLGDSKQVKKDKWVHEGSNEQVDACTITAILQIRDMLLEKGVSKDIAIIPEIKDSLSRAMCEQLSIVDFVETTGLPSKVLSMVAYQPRIQMVLKEMISHDGKANFSMHSLDMYVNEESRPTHFSFCQISELVAASGHIAIGWSKHFSQTSRARYLSISHHSSGVEFHRTMSRICEEAHGKQSMIEYELNPLNKTEEREWSWEDDKIVVLTCS